MKEWEEASKVPSLSSCGEVAQTCHDDRGCRAQGTARCGGSRRRKTGMKRKKGKIESKRTRHG